MKKAISSLAVLPLIFVLGAFSTKDAKPFKLPKAVDKNYVFVPMQDAILNGESTFNGAFFISKYEVTNIQYNEFLQSLKSENREADLAIAMIDSAQWSKNVIANAPYVEHYHSHPAYAQYPVVNITKAGAELYCQWISTQLNANNPDSDFDITVRLPSRTEWLRAATSNSKYDFYAWGGPYLKNAKGQALCNYFNIGDGSIYFDEATNSFQVKSELSTSMGVTGYFNDNADVTAPVNSYSPNALGIYNLNGNVAEMTSEKLACGGSWSSPGYDVRNESTVALDGATPTIGFRPVLTFIQKK